MVKWTDKMINELIYTRQPKLISKKYNMGYETARRKLLEIADVKSLAELKEKKGSLKKYDEELNKVEKEPKSTIEKQESQNKEELSKKKEDTTEVIEIFDKIKSILLDINSLYNKGISFYTVDNRNKLSEFDKVISDYQHILENEYDKLDINELSKISENIGIICRKRRIVKNEFDFLQNNRTECQGFIDFLKKIDLHINKIENKVYNTKILKEEVSPVVVVNSNNAIIKDLETENEKLKIEIEELKKNTNYLQTNDDIKKRLLELEKMKLKEDRKRQREKGEKISIDYLHSNWKEMFNAELDDITKNGIINDCYSKYSGINIKEVRDYNVWNKIIPDYLYSKKYFLK